MKKIIYTFVALLLVGSCKKNNISKTSDNGCISQLTTFPSLSTSDSITVAGLLKNNNLSSNNQVFYVYQSYNALNQQNQNSFFQLVKATQVQHGLPLFFCDLTYGFINGVSDGSSGILYSDIKLGTKPFLTLQVLRQLFLTEATRLDQLAVPFQDTCLVAQLGYYNTNLESPDTTVNFIRAWEVRPKYSQFPRGYFRDDNGILIAFFPLTNGSIP